MAVALLCGLLSSFVVLKRMAFIGQGISHAAFGGVGAALLASLALAVWKPQQAGQWDGLVRELIVAAFCVLSALAIGVITRRGRFSEDTSIGIVLVAAMALGVLLVDVRQLWLEGLINSGQVSPAQAGYPVSFETILFGDILSLGPLDALVAAVLAAVVLLWTVSLFKELVFFAFDEETAGVFGVRTNLLYYGLLVLLALAVVAALRYVGVILASALLVLPGASARCLSNRIGMVTLLSAFLAVASMAAGFLLAGRIGRLSAGPDIVLALCVTFAVSYVVGRAIRATR
jgi:ABC-type Mn2+/Zn2+ transport system permease subunit